MTLDPILVPRVVGTPNHAKVKQYIIDQMQSLGWSIETDKFSDNTPVGRKNFENIIATLDPAAPRRLVLACHFDSKYSREGTFVGATDSAVPCAMMITLARDLAAKLDGLKSTVSRNSFQQCDIDFVVYWDPFFFFQGKEVTLQFIFFDGEEAFRQWNDRVSKELAVQEKLKKCLTSYLFDV